MAPQLTQYVAFSHESNCNSKCFPITELLNLSAYPLSTMKVPLVRHHCSITRLNFADGKLRFVCVSVYYSRRWTVRGTPSPTTSTVETVMDILHYSRSMHIHPNTLKLIFSEVKLFVNVWISVEIVFLLSEYVCMKSNLCARSLNYIISRRGLCQGLHINTPILSPTYSYSPDSEGFCCIYSFIAH